MNYLIGAGGVGSWLAPSLCLLAGQNNVTLIDGDELEEKNLNRQLFTRQHLRMNKANALARLYNCWAFPEWYAMGKFRIEPEDVLLVCADNHPARAAALNECDARGCRAIIAANETHSSEAYYYQRSWRGTRIDPRVAFPEILTNRDGDPMGEAIGCTGEAQESTPQLVTANNMAASLAGWMFVLWIINFPKLEESVMGNLPWRMVANLSRLENHLVGKL